MNEVVELGAKFVTVKSNMQTIKEALSAEIDDTQFITVDGKRSFADGKVEVFDISTAHAEHYLLYYVPEAKLVFSADHFGTNLEEGLPVAGLNMVTFRAAVEALNLGDVRFVSAHGVRQLSMNDLRTATDAYSPGVCPTGFDICSN